MQNERGAILIERSPDIHLADLEGHEGEGRIVAIYKTRRATGYINNLYFRGKTREECIRDCSVGGKLSCGGPFKILMEEEVEEYKKKMGWS